MPKKTLFERNLTNIAISRKAHDLLFSYKRRGQPVYHLIDMIIAAYFEKDNEVRDWKELYEQQVETTKIWMQKYEQERQKSSQMRFDNNDS